MERPQLRQLFPSIKQSELLDYLLEHGQQIEISADSTLLDVEQFILHIPLLLSGLIRVYREEEGGREVLLYYIQAGESCAMTLAASMQDRRSKVKAVIEDDAKILAVPVEAVHNLGHRFPAWQSFVAHTFTMRFNEVLQVVEGIAFYHLDQRLLNYLEQKAKLKGHQDLQISHQQIADDLATSREVISRLLKQLDQRGLIHMSRGHITLL